MTKDTRCVNCGRPKFEHSPEDRFCLKVNNWKPQDFIEPKLTPESLELPSGAVFDDVQALKRKSDL